MFSFKYSPRPNTPALQYADSIPDAEKSRRLQILQEHQREIQRVSYRRHVGSVLEVMVEGKNTARGQMIGRTSQNKTLNFTCADKAEPKTGDYVKVQVTQAFPNSLWGVVRAEGGSHHVAQSDLGYKALACAMPQGL